MFKLPKTINLLLSISDYSPMNSKQSNTLNIKYMCQGKYHCHRYNVVSVIYSEI